MGIISNPNCNKVTLTSAYLFLRVCPCRACLGHVYVCAYVGVLACMRERQPELTLCPPSLLRLGLSLDMDISWLMSSRVCLSLWLQGPGLGLQMHVTTLSFYVGAGYTLSGPHACAVGTVPTKTSPPFSED